MSYLKFLNTDFFLQEITIPHKIVYRIAYLLLAIPFLVFLLTHLHFYISLPLACIFIWGLVCSFRRISEDNGQNLKLSVSMMIVLIAAALLFSWLAGQGGYFPQKYDHVARNAILHDLVTESWPVAYKHIPGSRMVYYYNYWLIPAGAAKLFLLFGDHVAMEAGQFFLFLWTSFWLFVILLLCCCKLQIKTLLKTFFLVMIFIGFSGMDCIGFWILHGEENPTHLEWWTYCQYSAAFTQLAWVFNQAVPAWLCAILIFGDKKIWHLIVIVAFSIVYAPFPAVGVAGIAAFLYLFEFVKQWRNHTIPDFIKNMCCAENIAISASILPVMALFHLSNGAVSDSTGDDLFHCMITDFSQFKLYLLFVLLEFAGIALLIWKDNKRNLLFYAIILQLLVLPMIHVISYDFCMRVSIPALCILSLYSIQFLLSEQGGNQHHEAKQCLLILFLIIGAATPFIEIHSSAQQMHSDNWRRYEYYSFTKEESTSFQFITNYVSFDADQKFFFKYLAKKPSHEPSD